MSLTRRQVSEKLVRLSNARTALAVAEDTKRAIAVAKEKGSYVRIDAARIRGVNLTIDVCVQIEQIITGMLPELADQAIVRLQQDADSLATEVYEALKEEMKEVSR